MSENLLNQDLYNVGHQLAEEHVVQPALFARCSQPRSRSSQLNLSSSCSMLTCMSPSSWVEPR